MTSGRRFVIRTRTRNGEDKFTPKGEDYYRHNRQEFVIKIPVMGYKYSRHGPIVHFVTYIPLTQAYFDGLRDIEYHHELQGILGAGHVRDRLSTRAEIEAAIKEAVHLYLSRLTESDTMGRKVIIHASSIYYVFDDTRPILFDEQVVRHIRHDGTPVIEYILNRPLLGMPVMPPNMYRKLGLCEIATYDLREQGGCIPVQITHCAMKRGSAAGSGGRGEQKRKEEMKPVFKDLKEIMDLFDKIFAYMYPGEAIAIDKRRQREHILTNTKAGERPV